MEDFKRIELKYLIDDDTYEEFIKELQEYVVLDKYNINGKPYSIYNLYFDNEAFYIARSALVDQEHKFKVRLRSYEIPTNNSIVYLELKEKYNGIVMKKRTSMTLEESYKLLNKQMLPTIEQSEITKIIDICFLKPKTFISYDRIAYTALDQEDLRITFDFNIVGRNNKLYLDKKGGKKLCNSIVLEIKTNDGIPHWLIILLAKYKINSQSFSKYIQHYKKQQKG